MEPRVISTGASALAIGHRREQLLATSIKPQSRVRLVPVRFRPVVGHYPIAKLDGQHFRVFSLYVHVKN